MIMLMHTNDIQEVIHCIPFSLHLYGKQISSFIIVFMPADDIEWGFTVISSLTRQIVWIGQGERSLDLNLIKRSSKYPSLKQPQIVTMQINILMKAFLIYQKKRQNLSVICDSFLIGNFEVDSEIWITYNIYTLYAYLFCRNILLYGFPQTPFKGHMKLTALYIKFFIL